MYVLDIGNKVRTKAYIFFSNFIQCTKYSSHMWGHAKIASNFKKGEKPRKLKFTSLKCVTSTVFRVYVRIFVKFARLYDPDVICEFPISFPSILAFFSRKNFVKSHVLFILIAAN